MFSTKTRARGSMSLAFWVACIGVSVAVTPKAAHGAQIVTTAAYQTTNTASAAPSLWTEGNREIMAAKRAAGDDLGSMVYLYVQNRGEPAALETIRWNGEDIENHAGPPDYRAIWWRLNPPQLDDGQEGEIAICLRSRLTEPTRFTVRFTNGAEVSNVVGPDGPPFRLGTIGFGPGLERVYLYVERLTPDAPLPQKIYLNGHRLGGQVRWLSRDWVGNIVVGAVKLRRPLDRGKFYTFRVVAGKQAVAATLRAFTGLSRFGFYGIPNFDAQAGNGLNLFSHFHSTSKEMLERAHKLGIKMAIHNVGGSPPPELAGHPGVYAWLGRDEPDCHDYGAGGDRAMQFRLGTLAMDVMDAAQRQATEDPATPTMLTLDCTFVPRNYFVYGQMADIINPDFYVITQARSVRQVKERFDAAKQASAPRLLSYTYQCMWQERPNWDDGPRRHMGVDSIREWEGVELFDRENVRGFGRAPAAGEVRRMMLYGIGCGARALLGYQDATFYSKSFFQHGAYVLPEIWEVVGRTSRALRRVAPLIEISHPIVWARPDRPKLWTRTLLAGEQAALVVVVNDDYQSVREGFTQTPKQDVEITFQDLPWLQPVAVWKVGGAVSRGGFTPVPLKRTAGSLSWLEPEISDAEIYLVAADPALAARLEEDYRKRPPFATEAGSKRTEDYLNGRRKTPPPPKPAESESE